MQKIINKVQMGRSFGHNNSLQKYVNKNIRNVMCSDTLSASGELLKRRFLERTPT